MKRRLHAHHCPDGRRAPALDLVKVVEPTETGLLVSWHRPGPTGGASALAVTLEACPRSQSPQPPRSS